ncbi:MAG: radical SAM protein [Deltaproteobacteria bacterium]|nr:radical SAM protein [Deltaproteobacteria bacterium]
MKAGAALDRYAHLATSYLASSRVSYLILYVTSRCNLRCNMCFYADSLNAPSGDGLTLDELTKVSQSLPTLMQLTLTGGEPFLRADLAEVIEAFYGNSGVRSFTIPTNGAYVEAMEQVLERTLSSCPAATIKLGLSLDGPEDLHNEIRGSKRSYAQVREAHAMLRRLQRRHPNLIVTMAGVISSFNVHRARELIDLFLTEFPADDHTLQLTRGIPKDSAAKDVSPDEYERCVAYLEERREEVRRAANAPTHRMVRKLTTRTRRIVSKAARTNEFQVPCVAGTRLAILYDTGVLAPCEILATLDVDPAVRARLGGFTYGNVRDFDCDVQRAVSSPLGREIARWIADTRCRCTFECAIVASIFYQPRELLRTLATPLGPVAPGDAPAPLAEPS